MACPLYKSLKTNGTSFYAFPSAAEKISAAYQNQNDKMYFSNYLLLNFPAQNLYSGSGTNSNQPIYWDFTNATGQGWGFQTPAGYTPPNSFGDAVIESLRNYVANFEETMMTSKLNTTDYYFNNNSLNVPAEKIFFKWAKKMNLIDFEPANNGDQYIGTLTEFQSNNPLDTSYFPEVLWTERTTNAYSLYSIYALSSGPFNGYLQLVFQDTTNFKVGDIIQMNGETNTTVTFLNGVNAKVLAVTPATSTYGQSVTVNLNSSIFPQIGAPGFPTIIGTLGNQLTGSYNLIYNKLVQYIGEVNGINNVQQTNLSYTEVYAQVAGQNGATPDVLFRTMIDENYVPNSVFPILPSEIQPEIIGAEIYTSPIVVNPQNYPGGYYGQFDTTDFTYVTSNGDSNRRSGDYYGISGNTTVPLVNSANLDGISIDFDPSHYAKMNIYGMEVTNFEQFNALMVNNIPPSDFSFNAILWYYTYEDLNGNSVQDLYGISFLNNPNNSDINTGEQFPVAEKYVATDTQDGTSYNFSLDLNFNIVNENPQDTFNPEAINSLYSFDLFNQAMQNLASLNDSFQDIIYDNVQIKTALSNLTQQIYTQPQINNILGQISYMNNLLQLYSTNQIIPSNTIDVSNSTVGGNPIIQLNSIDPKYSNVTTILTTNLYASTGIVPFNYNITTQNKDFLIYISNNDQTYFNLPNNSVLTIVINRDLDPNQTMDLIINAENYATQNKQLSVFINYSNSNSAPVLTPIISNINLPVYYNTSNLTTNSAYNWSAFKFNIDLTKPLRLNVGSILEVPLYGDGNLISNSFNSGDTLLLNDFSVGTSSTIDFSGQYTISSVGATNSYIYLDISSNTKLISYGSSSSLPLILNNSGSYLLNNMPYFSLNKGCKISVTRVDPTDSSLFTDRYLVTTELY
jgi:hypothetical protein